MTARQLRESPRMVIATVLSAGVLVLIGILVASATAGTDSRSAPAPTRTPAVTSTPSARPNAAQASALRSAQATISQLRASLRTQGQHLSGTNASLRSAQAAARCWHAKVIHPIKTRGLHCAVPTS